MVSHRFRELDSLRGLAACTVVAQHCLLILPQTYVLVSGGYRGKSSIIYALIFSPIHILWAGREAVILFFLLSGFVLSLPFYSGQKIHYASFLVKRICRIYIPYAVAVTIAIAAAHAFSRHGIYGLSKWFNYVWTVPLDWQMVRNHYLLLGSFDNARLDPVIWSLVQEMRISIIFPLLMFFVLRFDWKIILASAIALYYIVGYRLDPLGITNLHLPYNDVLMTARYIGMFLAGALIAKHRRTLIQCYQSLPPLGHFLMLAAGIGLYTYTWLFPEIHAIHEQYICDAAICLGAALIIIAALSSQRLSQCLQKKPLILLGKISYSIYLFHAIELIACFNIFYGKLPYVSILGIAISSIFVVSVAAYYLCEEPSIKLGRYLTRRSFLLFAAYP